MSLEEKLAAFKARFESGEPPFEKIPPAAHATMRRAIDALIDSGAGARVPTSGPAPMFELRDSGGAIVRLAELLLRGPAVLSFYRGLWCPYCNLDVEELELHAAKIRAAGASLLAITLQTAANNRKLIAERKLSFPVLSDPGNLVAERYGLRYRLPDDLIALYRRLGVDLVAINGDDSWTLPIPARFIVDRQGQIRYAEADPDYTRRPEPHDLLPVLQVLSRAPADRSGHGR
jgi:peroxiredoxin